jgi:uncharacterized protein (TIGR03437 family)
VKTLSALAALLWVTLASIPNAAASQILLRYLDVGDQASVQALATDKAGNIFAVSGITNEAGRRLTRVNKLDPNGNALASFDFGGSGAQTPGSPLSGAGARPAAAAIDPQGNLIVVGAAGSTGFPLVSPLFPSVTGMSAFVTKIDSQLHQILFSTLLIGGSAASAVAVDALGNIYVVGYTGSTGLPITPGAYHSPTAANATVTFVVEISPNGDRVLLSTQFGGSSSCVGQPGSTIPSAVAIDSSGAIVFAGFTSAVDMPVTSGVIEPNFACTSNWSENGFVAKLSPGGAQLVWSTFLNGGESSSHFLSTKINSLLLDSGGNVLLGGITPGSPGFPITTGALQSVLPASAAFAGFLTLLNPTVSQIIWSTYLGGAASDAGLVGAGINGLAKLPDGRIAVTGYSDLNLLPAFPGLTDFGNTFSALLSANGSRLQELRMGPDDAAGQSLVLTPSANIVTAGLTGSVWIETSRTGPSLLATANAASGTTSGLVAPYELVSLYGEGIGPQTAISGQVVNGAFTKSLGGYSVTFDGIAAPLLYLGPTQINTAVPHQLAGQDSTHLQIVTPAGTVDGPTLFLRQAQPDIFQNGDTGLTVALNEDGSLNTAQNPAKQYSVVTIFATGAGSSDWDDGFIVPPDHTGSETLPVSVIVGGSRSLEVVSAADAPGAVAGVMQISFRVSGASTGTTPPQLQFEIEAGEVLGGSGVIFTAP